MSKDFYLSFLWRHFLALGACEGAWSASASGMEKTNLHTFQWFCRAGVTNWKTGVSDEQLLFTEHWLIFGATQKAGELGQKFPEGEVKSLAVSWKWLDSNTLSYLQRSCLMSKWHNIGDCKTELRSLKDVVEFSAHFQTCDR